MKKLYYFIPIFFSLMFVLCWQDANAQSDACAGATALTVGGSCTTTAYNVSAAFTNSTTEAPFPCSGTSYRDGWYKFTPASTGNVNIDVTSNRIVGVAVYSGSCGAFSQVACTVPGTANASLTAAVTASTTYYLRIMRTNNANANDMTGTVCLYTGYCPASTTTSTTEYINNFTTTNGITNIGNTTGFTAGGYANYTAQSVSQPAGQTINFSTTFIGGTFGFGIWVDWNNDLDFNDAGETMFLSSSYSASYSGSFTVPGGAGSGNYRMRIRADYFNTSPLACGAITDGEAEDYTLTVTAPLPCPTLPSGLASLVTGTTSATISWVAPSPAPGSGYQYYVSTSATPPTAGTAPTGSTAAGILSASLTGLTPNTTYYFWVRSNCDGTNKGAWAGSSTFFTGYCVSNTSTSTTEYISNFTTTGGLSNINNTSGFTAGGYANYTAQSVSQLAGQSLNFSAAFTGGTFGFGIWIDWNNDLDFNDAGETMFLSAGYNSTYSGSFAIPGAATGNYRMRIRADYWSVSPSACGTITDGETEDYTLAIPPPLPCATYPSALASAVTSGSTATISWAAASPAPVNGYQYYVSTSSTAPLAGTTPSGSTAAGMTSAALTGLTANTTYYFWVRSNCNGTDYGFWVGAGTFYTGYCISTSSVTSGYINNFTTTGGLANISNSTAYSAGGYGNYTAQAVTQLAGLPVSFSAAYTGGTFGMGIWVDWNNDLDFNDAGETVYTSAGYNAANTGSFTIPAAAATGNYRMRVRIDYIMTSPTACGNINNGETEDYTLTVAPPLPCSGNPSAISVNVTSGTTVAVSWLAATPAPANGYQYYVSTSSTTPVASTTPTGSTAAGVLTANLSGLTAGVTYYVWVRSNCGGALGQGVWIGATTFNIPTCGVGNSTGTTTLGCPSVVSGGLGLNGADPAPVSCTSASCVDLEATYLQLGQTTSYTVESIPYNPPYQFTCLKNPVSVNIDDTWSPIINLPFNFCFYGNTYNKCLISSNGVVTFDITSNLPGQGSAWQFTTGVPSTSLFLNSIFGVYHDINPSLGGEVGWELITLNTGCRALVASWNNIPMYSCTSQLYSGMIVLYENTNIIDVYVKQKSVCATWNDGNAIVGVQNSTGTQGIAAPSRNGLDANWTVTNEAWRFVPSGTAITSIKWFQGAGTTGPVVGNTDVITVCPSATTVYTAQVTYTLCNGATLIETESTTVTVNSSKTWNGSVSTAWNNAANWTPAGVPTALDCVVIPPAPNNAIISGASYDAFAYSLSVLAGGVLTMNSGNNLTVTNAVNVSAGGTFTVMDSASLLQVNAVANTGNINMQRTTQPMYRYDFTYWNSPVTQASNYTLGTLSPNTLFDKYFSWTPSVGGASGIWIQESAATVMDPRKGYIVRAPQTYSTNPAIKTAYTATFTGVPNNGVITCPISYGSMGPAATNDKWNLLGNPYPSAVSAASFLNNPSNASVIDGTIYFWTHNTPWSTAFPDPFYGNYVINYTDADYASWNKTGGVGTVASSGGPAPNGYIAAGEAFFVKSLGVPGSAIFNNSMRVADNNSQFFRVNPNASTAQAIERHRIWLNFTNESGSFNQILVGYITGATLGWDRGLDGERFSPGSVTFYSIIPENHLAIQGRPLPFQQTDQVPLGFSTVNAGNFSIRIDHIDGLFENQNIYLEDRYNNTIHDLKQNPYEFFTASGTFDNRFVLRYTTTNLNLSDASSDLYLNAFIRENRLHARSLQPIISIEISDVAGKVVRFFKATEKSFEADLDLSSGVYFARFQLQDGTLTTRKLMN
ncbi:MAG: T9SS type A sorting domain-containing protein [Flavobacterium sp.]|nr:MAG: T9SS type A sorting domain-containing protein [Flavobacterium sp.]